MHDSRHSAMASPYSANERFHGEAAHPSQPEKNSDLLRWTHSCPPLRGGRRVLGVIASTDKVVTASSFRFSRTGALPETRKSQIPNPKSQDHKSQITNPVFAITGHRGSETHRFPLSLCVSAAR